MQEAGAVVDVQTFADVMGRTLPTSRYEQLLPAWNACLTQAGCTTVRRAAMLTAQVGHESDGLLWMSEIASGAAYEGRLDLGNTQPGDGRRFKGHGPIQITGRANHAAVSQWAHSKGYVPTPTYFVDQPEQLAGDQYGFLGVVWYWTVARPQLNQLADAGDIVGATRAVNGGTNGLADREQRYAHALSFDEALLPSTVQWVDVESTLPVLREGDGYPPLPCALPPAVPSAAAAAAEPQPEPARTAPAPAAPSSTKAGGGFIAWLLGLLSRLFGRR